MAGSLPSATDGKVQVLCRLPRTAKSLPSATVGKLTKWVSSQEAQLAATWLLCRPRQTAKALCRRWQTAKSLHIVCFFCFLLNPTICSTYHIYKFHIQHISNTYLAHKFHITYHISFIHTHCSYIRKFHPYTLFHPYIYYNAKCHEDSKLDTMQSFIKGKASTPS